MTSIQDQLNEPVVINEDGVTVGGKKLLVDQDSVHVTRLPGGVFHSVTVELLTENLTVDTDSQLVKDHVTVSEPGLWRAS